MDKLRGTVGFHAMRFWMALPPFRGRDRMYLVALSHLKAPPGLVRYRGRDALLWDLDLSQECDAVLFVYGDFEPEVLDTALAVCDENTVAIDAGANIGCISVPLSRRVRSVHAFEPTPVTYSRLTCNFTMNGCANAVAVQAALGAASATGVLSSPAGRNVSNRVVLIEEAVSSGGDVVVDTLDRYCQDHHLAPTFLKIDVEGAEWDVLRGAASVLERHPKLIIEISTETAAAGGFHPLSMLAWLRDEYGYEFREITQTGLRSIEAWQLEDNLLSNVFGLHPSDAGLFDQVESSLSRRRRRSRFEVWPNSGSAAAKVSRDLVSGSS